MNIRIKNTQITTDAMPLLLSYFKQSAIIMFDPTKVIKVILTNKVNRQTIVNHVRKAFS